MAVKYQALDFEMLWYKCQSEPVLNFINSLLLFNSLSLSVQLNSFFENCSHVVAFMFNRSSKNYPSSGF
jgi:hypothetical protein